MDIEKKLASYIVNQQYQDLSPADIEVVKKQLLAFFGGVISGWNSGGCRTAAEYIKDLGGKEESTIYIWNGKAPAQHAAFVNSVMGRALDICDHISPGVHIGSAVIPAAFATAEMMGGCSGKDLILSIAVGTDLSLRLNMPEDCYDGFDPTSVNAVFAAAAASAKLMKLNEERTLHALALAFNRCGGSFQSNIDGALSVRFNEGFTAQAGVESARLAARDITGPKNFLEGIYGYFHIFGRDRLDPEAILDGLGEHTFLNRLSFKKYPSCGMTQGGTEVILRMLKNLQITDKDIQSIHVTVTPYAAKLVGKEFEPGDNPKVDAQFNVGYCVANAVMRAPVTLGQFEPDQVLNPAVLRFLKEKVTVSMDAALNRKGHYTTRIDLILNDGRSYADEISVIPGTPGNELTKEDFLSRYYDCIAFGGREDLKDRAELLLDTIMNFEKCESIDEITVLMKGDR